MRAFSVVQQAAHRVGGLVLDLLYPPTCAACGAGGAWWCAACRAAVERLPRDPCPKCLSADAGHDPALCAGALPFAGAAATGFYHSPPLRLAIGDLKYRGVTAAQGDMAAYLADVFSRRQTPLPWAHEPALGIQPLPLESGRERERGFNQAKVIAELLLPFHPGATLVSLIARASSRPPQANIEDHALRAANVAGAFVPLRTGSLQTGTPLVRRSRPTVPLACPYVPSPCPRTFITPQPPPAVLLVDDVATTGSTSAVAALALFSAGVERVYLFTLALGR